MAADGYHLHMIEADPFVGRERELTVLREAFEAARGGRGGVVLVSGEAGIGKTRLVQEIESVACANDAIVVWGRCYDIGGAPPYWPWTQVVEALGNAVEEHPDRTMRGEGGVQAILGHSAPALAPIAPGFVRTSAHEPQGRTEDPESARFELFVAVERLLRDAADTAPILVVLDDLQWADPASLSMLEFVASSLPKARVLLIATCRDVAPHTLDSTFNALARMAGFRAIELTGLSASDVASYVERAIGAAAVATGVPLHERTRGNPFFVREIARVMALPGSDSLPPEIPASIRAALSERLAPLPDAVRELLRSASVVGQSVEVRVLAQLSGRPLAETAKLLEEGARAGVIKAAERPGTYRFAHDLMREALLEDVPASRSAALHGEAGDGLEALLGIAAGERAAELAQHFVAAARLDVSYAAKAAQYSDLAGSNAEAVWAWQEAAAHYQRALEFADTLDDAPTIEAGLLLALGRVQRDGQQWGEAETSLRGALERYRQLEDWYGFGKAVAAFRNIGGGTPWRRELAREALAVDDGRDPALRAELLMRVARSWDDAEARAAAEQSERLADEHGVAGVQHELAFRRALFSFVDDGLDAALPLFEEAHRWAVAAGDLRREYSVVATRTALTIRFGRLAHALEPLAELDELVRARRDASGFAATAAFHDKGLINFLHGDLTPPEPDTHNPGARPAEWYVAMHQAVRFEVGGEIEAAAALMQPAPVAVASGPAGVAAGLLARLRWRAGGGAAARADFERWRTAVGRDPRSFLGPVANACAALDDALLALADDETIAWAYAELTEVPEERLGSFALGGGLDQLRGGLALHLDFVDEAERWYRAGVEWAEAEGCPIELGRNLAGLGEVAERRGQRSDALRCFERAVSLFEKYRAILWRDQWQRRLEELRAAPAHGRPRYQDGLSPREVEVLRLIPQGRSNAAIADALGIAPGTVARHVTSILRKTGAANRTEAASYAARQGLS